MTQGLLPWSPCHHSLSPTSLFALPLAFPTTKNTLFPVSISSTLEPEPEPATATTQQLTARERRQLRNERRERKTATSWKEEVEEKLLEKPTKKFANWKEELNLNNLAHEGPQWWIIEVSRVKGQETAQLIARQLARNYPHIDFKAENKPCKLFVAGISVGDASCPTSIQLPERLAPVDAFLSGSALLAGLSGKVERE